MRFTTFTSALMLGLFAFATATPSAQTGQLVARSGTSAHVHHAVGTVQTHVEHHTHTQSHEHEHERNGHAASIKAHAHHHHQLAAEVADSTTTSSSSSSSAVVAGSTTDTQQQAPSRLLVRSAKFRRSGNHLVARSKIGDKIKHFFHKVGEGLKKVATFVGKAVGIA